VCLLFLLTSGFLVHAEPAATAPSAAEGTSSASPVPPQNAERFSFESDVSRVLDLVINSLYQHNEIFLRELISNASDALDKIRYLLLTQPDKYKSKDGKDIDLEVQIEYDAEQQTLTIRDTGVGMTHEDMVKNLGTIARSGTTKFLEALKESGSDDAKTMSQIGQFGVGFYSSFLVADRVTVASKSPLEATQHVWESQNGSHDFLIYPDPRGNTLERGTEITLHLKDDSLEYVDPVRLKELARHYSEFVMYPISLRTTSTVEVEVEDDDDDEEVEEKKEKKTDEDELEVEEDADIADKPKKTKEVTTHSWEKLNSNQAIWTREKETITDDEYQAFWQVLSGDETNSSSWVHFDAEGKINFKSILYLPEQIPINYRYGQIDKIKGAMRLYVKKVLIGDEFDLLPRYLSFIRGVVDSDDLPLNVNRETLQEHKILTVIKKKLVRKAIDLIRQFEKDSYEEAEDAEAEVDADGNVVTNENKKSKKNKYEEWYSKFSPNIKLGVLDDEPNRGKLMKLLRYQTSKSNGTMIPLTKYVENMKEWQKEIYVLGGTSIEEIEKSPFLEAFKEKDIEVVYFTDPVDEYMVPNVREFDGKKFVQASSESVKFKDEDEDLIKRREKAYTKKFKKLTKWLRQVYSGSIMRVQVAKRSLGAIPAIVSSSEYGTSANMERIMRAQAFQAGVDPFQTKAMKVFEINPRHPIILKLLEECPDDDTKDETPKVSEETLDAAWMIHDMAMLNGGFPISDHKGHNKRMSKMLQKMYGLESLELEPEIDPPVEEDEPPEDKKKGGLNMEDFGGDGMGDFNFDDLDLDSMGINLDDLASKTGAEEAAEPE